MGTWKTMGLICDVCDEYTGWGEASMEDVRITAKDEGWHRVQGRDICPHCFQG
jgi:hypothetical protein